MAYKTIIGTMKTAGTLDISAGDIDLAAGSVDNADLAGSIANSKLVNDSVTVTAGNGLSGGGEVDLGASVSVALDLNELSAAAVAVGADSIAIVIGVVIVSVIGAVDAVGFNSVDDVIRAVHPQCEHSDLTHA